MKKQENILAEAAQSLKFLFRHRKGLNIMGKQIDQVKLGKKVFFLNHEIPGAIQDTFDNLGYLTKDKRRPVLAAKRKTTYG